MRNSTRLTQILTSRISPQAFVRLALMISGMWLLAVYPVLHWVFWERFPKPMRMEGSDFGQYYTGALVARYGLWSHLYPTPNREVYDNPPQFKPLIPTKLFDPADPHKRKDHWFFYPQIADPKGSTVAPEILALCPRLKSDWRFVYPPPVAVLLWPLGYFELHAASRGVWFSLMCASYFGMAYFSSRICRMLWKKATYIEGWIAILPMIPTCFGSDMSTTFSVGNISPFLGFLIACVSYAWLCNRQALIGLGMILLLVFKGIGISWCPLLIVKPLKWKTLAVMASLTLLLNTITLYYGGTGLYRTFFAEVLPKANIATGIGLQGLLKTFLGQDLTLCFAVLNLLLLGALYCGYWRQRQVSTDRPCASAIIATMAGTMAVFGLCSRVVWPNYYTNYLLLPFSGWIFWEGFHTQGAWKKWIFGMFTLGLLAWLDSLFLLKDSWLMEWLKYSGFYNERVGQARTVVNGLVVYLLPSLEFSFLLVLAYRRLFFAPPVIEEVPVEDIKILADSRR